jgi:hypothetical protein
MIFFLVLVLSLFLSLLVQQFIPPLTWLYEARVLLMPSVLFFSALAMPFWAMLVLVFVSGLMWDALNAQMVDGNVEISLGWSILLYAALCSIMSGFRPLFLRGRWEIHCLLSGLFTAVIVLAEFLMISFRRGTLVFNPAIWGRIGGAGLIALLLAPLVFFLFRWIASLCGYGWRVEVKK